MPAAAVRGKPRHRSSRGPYAPGAPNRITRRIACVNGRDSAECAVTQRLY